MQMLSLVWQIYTVFFAMLCHSVLCNLQSCSIYIIFLPPSIFFFSLETIISAEPISGWKHWEWSNARKTLFVLKVIFRPLGHRTRSLELPFRCLDLFATSWQYIEYLARGEKIFPLTPLPLTYLYLNLYIHLYLCI